MTSSLTLADLTIFKENVNTRLSDWIQNLSSVEVNEALSHLELHTNVSNLEEDAARRDELCVTFIQSAASPEDLRNDGLTVIDAEKALENSRHENIQLPSSSPHDCQKDQDMSLTMTVYSRPQMYIEADLINFETLQVPTLLYTIAINNVAPSHFSTTIPETTNTTASTGAHYSGAIGTQATVASTTLQNIASSSQNIDIKNPVRTVLPNGDVQFISFAVATELQRAWISERELQNNLLDMNNYILEQAETVRSLSSKIVDLEEVTKDLHKQLKSCAKQYQEYLEYFPSEDQKSLRLDNIPDEELLDSMVPTFEKPALFWYRTLRPLWQTYQDFKRAALNNYSRTKRNKRNLVVEAHLRMQWEDEPVRDYIGSLLTILSRFDPPWDLQDQVKLVIDNMFPKLKKKMKIYKGRLTSLQEFLDKAQEAKYDEDGQWRPPPPADQSMLSETAYRPTSKAARAKLASMNLLSASGRRPSVLPSSSPGLLPDLIAAGGCGSPTPKWRQNSLLELQLAWLYEVHLFGLLLLKAVEKRERERVDKFPTALKNPRTFNTISVTGVAQTLHGTASDSPLAMSKSTDVESSCNVDTVASVEVSQYKFKGLYDTGTSRTVLGSLAISLAASLNRRVRPYVGPEARAVDGHYFPIIGSVKLPYTVGGITHLIDVFILSEVDTECTLSERLPRNSA
ncbi:hypothetical protein TSAR_002220 [Trichomalopsis sarcophagae]|uniref:Retrotransposon gag domain-containing protein n=1 Tax=Trichomalopsis sarcophagae TaxID=543379 RepID=A0A232EQZ1_9HYME|nr:hypothetical protein TSAR_002220 [Trichomalopsis sarcophagae]